MFRALLCPSSGARDYDVDYHIDRFVLGLLYVGGKVQLGCNNVRVAGSSTVVLEPVFRNKLGNFQPLKYLLQHTEEDYLKLIRLITIIILRIAYCLFSLCF